MIARHLDSDKRAVCTTRQNENQAPTHNNLRQAMPLKTRIEQTLLRKMGQGVVLALSLTWPGLKTRGKEQDPPR